MLTLTAPETIAAYIRVSTYDQKTESQREEISRWLRNHGVDPETIRWFEDKETGKNLNRLAFQQLQKAIFAGEIKTLLVWKLDRISRRMLEGMNTVARWLKQDIRLISITQQIDISGIVGEMMIAMLFGFGEIELQYNKERQAAGIALAKQRGVYKGRKKGTKKLKPAEVKELRKTLSVAQIAKHKEVSERTVYNALEEIN